MASFYREIIRNRWVRPILITLAALSYNNWLLAPLLNPVLFSKNGSVSEFSVLTQPHYFVFRALDILAGLLLAATVIFFAGQLYSDRYGKLILITTFILGAANIADALAALPCSETLNAACRIPIVISFNGYNVPTHAYSSTVIAVCYLLLPLFGLLYGLRNKSRYISLSSAALVIMALASFVLAVLDYIKIHGLTVHTTGRGQEIQMIILAVWIIGFYLFIDFRHTKTEDL